MLNLSLPAVSRAEVPVRGEISPTDPVWEGTDAGLAEPLSVDLVARQVGEGVLVRGTMRTSLALECRRCLEPVTWEIDDTVDLLFEPLTGGEEEEELKGEVYALPTRGTELDLREALRQELLLRVPGHVVCEEACKGLCPQCGANLNETTCECVPEASPSPWGALNKIKFD